MKFVIPLCEIVETTSLVAIKNWMVVNVGKECVDWEWDFKYNTSPKREDRRSVIRVRDEGKWIWARLYLC